MRGILYISIFFQGDAAVTVRVVHVEQNWGGRGGGAHSGALEGSWLPLAPQTFPAPESTAKTPIVKCKCQSHRDQGHRPWGRPATSWWVTLGK